MPRIGESVCYCSKTEATHPDLLDMDLELPSIHWTMHRFAAYSQPIPLSTEGAPRSLPHTILSLSWFLTTRVDAASTRYYPCSILSLAPTR